MAYRGISAYLKCKTNKEINTGYKAMQPHQHLIKNRLYQANQELISYNTKKLTFDKKHLLITLMSKKEIPDKPYTMTWLYHYLCRTNNALPNDYK